MLNDNNRTHPDILKFKIVELLKFYTIEQVIEEVFEQDIETFIMQVVQDNPDYLEALEYHAAEIVEGLADLYGITDDE